MKSIRPTTKHVSGQVLGVRYAELLRLRESVELLERACDDTAERPAIKRYRFPNAHRVRPGFPYEGG
jgi:hypothetical protein